MLTFRSQLCVTAKESLSYANSSSRPSTLAITTKLFNAYSPPSRRRSISTRRFPDKCLSFQVGIPKPTRRRGFAVRCELLPAQHRRSTLGHPQIGCSTPIHHLLAADTLRPPVSTPADIPKSAYSITGTAVKSLSDATLLGLPHPWTLTNGPIPPQSSFR
uniref:Uncharacterized protein n=1 Tax=Panagrellus redivivus TaxID=6233 RepID=A0A7E4VVZ0_PANRE